MSRFLFATLGSLGDLHPYIAVAKALLERDQQAVIATSEEYRTVVEAEGIEFVAISPSIEQLGDRQQLVTRLFDVRHGPEYLMSLLVMPYLRPVYEQLLESAKQADLLISHPLTMTLPLVAEKLQKRWVSTILAPMSLMSCYDPPTIAAAPWTRHVRRLGLTPYRMLFGLMKLSTRSWEAPLRQFRRQLGLPSVTHPALFEGQYSPLLNLALFDSPLAEPQPDWPVNTRVCGSALFDGTVPMETDLAELDRFLAAGEPPIVFALGSSAIWIAGDFWDQATAAVQQLGKRAILITGQATHKTLPDNIKAFTYLPYSSVFPHAALIVHQAGVGTLSQALRAGHPQLIVPVAFDQPDNARRTAMLGIARTLPFKSVTTKRLVAELTEILNQPDYVRMASRLAKDLAAINGAANAADELIRCVTAK